MRLASTPGPVVADVRTRRLPRRAPWLAIGSVWIVAVLTLPLFGLIYRAGSSGGLLEAMGRPVVFEALRLSALTSLAALAVSVVFGTPLALLLSQKRHGHRQAAAAKTSQSVLC